MAFNSQSVKSLLKKGEIKKLFIEELGWDSGKTSKDCKVSENSYQLKEVAQKAGFKVWLCSLPSSNLPQREEIKLVHRQLVKESFEHIIIFLSNDAKSQSWLWVRRDTNKPISYKHHIFSAKQDGESLIQKLRELFIAFDEEEKGISISDVTGKAKKAFDVEKVTKKFYHEFDKHRNIFLGFIEGIPVDSDREWYASVMLNRLMFAYFIQKKGFLDSNPDYLKSKLKECQQKKGQDKFYSFYRIFLLRLFHEGLGAKKVNRPKDLESLLGNIPYLNGGMFDVHELELPERYGKTIEIKDEAFQKVFAYFDQYQWHLDERPLKNDNEINPDVLGYIFEKYINQKQMGAYYTKEDITEYISKNSIIPFIFDTVKVKYPSQFDSLDSQIWGLLRKNPDEYIFNSLRHGIEHDFPQEIALGVDTSKPELLNRRAAWNKPAPSDFALPTETWRDVVVRRNRYFELKKKILAGEVRSIDMLITLNLDIRQFALEVIDNCEDAELIWAFWQSIYKITVLDPTGGSGAFLFSALNILEPLYEACLERMEFLLLTFPQHERIKDFQEVLGKAKSHSNRKYFILKSIILNNLYAVDIMEEAVEICKLRLFLKLAAQVEPDVLRDNFGIEPLPDIDFNICSGNSLVGYATYDEVNRLFSSGLSLDNTMEKIAQKAVNLQQTFDDFRQSQTSGDNPLITALKIQLQKHLKAFEEELNHQLAGEYGVKIGDSDAYLKWLNFHKPFHWFIQFYGILNSGGFDVIIGNPPYVSLRKIGYKIPSTYRCLECGDLFALCTERAYAIGRENSRIGLIIPLSATSTDTMVELKKYIKEKSNSIWTSYYSASDQPASLFTGVRHRLLILLSKKGNNSDTKIQTTRFIKWFNLERDCLFSNSIIYTDSAGKIFDAFCKISSKTEISIMQKMFVKRSLSYEASKSGVRIYYHNAPVHWGKVFDFVPHFRVGKAKPEQSSHLKSISFNDDLSAKVAICFLNSSLFYWFNWQYSNCRDLSSKDIMRAPLDISSMQTEKAKQLDKLASKLMTHLKENKSLYTRIKDGIQTEFDAFYPAKSKNIIDQIDFVLADHFGLTQEELDFIINYDIKYRMGKIESDDE